jgi:DNA polymerase III subunit chi
VQVDFYIVDTPSQHDADLVCCRVVEKAWTNNVSAQVLTDTLARQEEINDLIWTFKQNSFIPHERDEANDATPATIFVAQGTPKHPTKMLINLTLEIPPFYKNYTRIAEIVAAEHKKEGRIRYKFYRDLGFTLKTHNL